jgi:hypothetical protein
MSLRCEVVDLVRLHLRQQRYEPGAVSEIAVVQEQPHIRLVRVDVQVIEAVGVERRGASDHAMDFVALGEQQLGEV